MDRLWAELCYVRLWLHRNYEEGSHAIFFNEPSFAWSTLEDNFRTTRAQIVALETGVRCVWRRPSPANAVSRIKRLARQYCRLAACLIVFKNDTKRGAIRDAEQFGTRVASFEVRANPLRYVVLFMAAIVFSIYLGVWLSVTLWNLANPTVAAAIFDYDANFAQRWAFYAIAVFGAPIVVVLLLRYLGWTYNVAQPASYLSSYAAILVIALFVSAASLALAIEWGNAPHSGESSIDLIYRNFKWAWSPALMCVYAVYHVDRQIDPLLPDVGTLVGESIVQRLIACLLFAFLVALFALLPTTSLSARPGSGWPVEKLQSVVIGTVFTIGFIMALVSEFGLPKLRRQTAQTQSDVSFSVTARVPD